MDVLSYIQAWRYSYCNDDWEHREGIRIRSTSSQGWAVEISVVDTKLEDAPLGDINFQESNESWGRFSLHDGHFIAEGGVGNLRDLLQGFCTWMFKYDWCPIDE
jgi:Immunity protein 53